MPENTLTASLRLKSAQEIVDACSAEHLRLYLIQRVPAPGVPKSRRTLNKYSYEAQRIDIEADVAAALLQDAKQDLERVIRTPELEFSPYAIISDDAEEIIQCTPCSETGHAFADIVHAQLTAGIRTVTVQRLTELADNLWAACISFELPDQLPVYTFARLEKGKVALSEREQSRIRTLFSSSDDKLRLMSGTTLSLPRRIAFLRYADEFFFLKKKEAETVLGLDDEYQALAENLCTELDAVACIDGMQFIRDLSQKSPAINKLLAQIKRLGNHENLDSNRLSAIKELITKHGLKVRIENGRICVDDEDAAKDFLRLLNDYYVESKQTGHSYGANTKKRLAITAPRT